ncbi:MAG: hypothetical protein AB7L84_04965 [Acidimicrobiia bacterium]
MSGRPGAVHPDEAGLRAGGDGGQVGSIEVLPFGLLTFAIGALLVANAWAVVDARFATDAAAREAARTYVEGTGEQTALADALAVGRAALAGHGRSGEVRATGPASGPRLERCATVTFEARLRVPALTLPLIGGYGRGFEVVSRHREVVDPYRDGLAGEPAC